MKVLFGAVLVLTMAVAASAGIAKPEVTIGLNVGEGPTGTLGGIEPKVKWAAAGEVAGFDVEGGLELTITEVDEPPIANIWGKLKRSIEGYGDISVRGDVDANARDIVDLDVRASGFGTAVQVIGQASPDAVVVSKLSVTKDIDTLGGTLTLTPKYDVGAKQGDIRMGYAMNGTSFQVDAQKRQLTVAHAFTDRDTIQPSISAAGDVSLSYSRDLDGGRVTTTWAPDDSVKLQWSDGVYETTIKAPLDGYYNVNRGIKVNMKRTVGML